MASLSYLNRHLTDLGTLSEKLDKYEHLVGRVRDFLHPTYKLMTRTHPDRTYSWVKAERTDCTTISESVSFKDFVEVLLVGLHIVLLLGLMFRLGTVPEYMISYSFRTRCTAARSKR